SSVTASARGWRVTVRSGREPTTTPAEFNTSVWTTTSRAALAVLNTRAATPTGVPAVIATGVSVTPRTSATAGRTATAAVAMCRATVAAAVTPRVNSPVEVSV